MCLPLITNYPPYNFAAQSSEPIGLFGWQATGSLEALPPVPIPPTQSCGLSGVIDGTFPINDIAPYFKLDLSGSLDTTTNVGLDFNNSGQLGNNPSNNVISLYLGNKNNTQRIATTSNDNAPQSYPVVKYIFDEPSP